MVRCGMRGSYRPRRKGGNGEHTQVMAEPSSSGSQQCLLIYDGRCRMCVTAKGGLERLAVGHKVRMIPYQSDEARQVLGPRHQEGRPEAAFLVTADGSIASGLDAFLPLLPGLRGGRLLAKFLAVPHVKPVGDWIYRLVARYRYRLFGDVPLDLPR
jgi:predicted DCC family thiol-disulfide oxidoreductase YuxK